MTDNLKRNISKDTSSIKRIVFTALPALVLAEIAQKKDPVLIAFGAILIAIWIYNRTLRKGHQFDYIMVMFMCCLFPVQIGFGGVFPLVAMLIYFIQLFSFRKFGEINTSDAYFKPLIGILLLSSVLGWLFVNQSDNLNLFVSILSFVGILSLLYFSGSVIVTPLRIVLFIKLNVFLTFYSLIASLNTIVKIIPNMVLLPQWAGEWINTNALFEAGAGGIVGVSPLNGQFNLLLAILFFSFYFYSLSNTRFIINKKVLITGVVLSVINIFTAGSKAVFTSMIVLVFLVYLLQRKLSSDRKLGKSLYQAVVVLVITVGIFGLVSTLGFDHILKRFEYQIEKNEENTGKVFTLEGVLDGTVLNRSNAFEAAFVNYDRRNWFIGYGWSTHEFQLDAFYGNSVFRTTRGGSAHSQYFSTLFLFGWIGFLAFWILHVRLIKKSYIFLSQKMHPIENRIFAMACIGMVLALMIHGVTADNTWYASYFASTLITIGLGFSNVNSVKYHF
ncbi:MAG: hypothetical protein A2X11_09240 [Bacteroidetes bacterium GWE2_42_24]|nr:MAG: hypothetical protein A2X11_09240 [Bacteroidetes bacterium GWE2_42_24]OFY31198.1 MAG: hypothetical protein A2X09_14800 [Bacteroidetes bacterium GWF2_43_11]HCT86490.1 hypothetical protein [Candidatus Margulisiibacteriota bacterium]